jgi:hypothetical protein
MSTTPECLDPIEKLEKKPPLIEAESILLKVSITITKRKDDKESHCLKPRELLKKLDGLPFTKMEKCTEEIECAIQEHNFSPKPHILSKKSKKSQLT